MFQAVFPFTDQHFIKMVPGCSASSTPGRVGDFPLLIRKTALSWRDAISTLKLHWIIWFHPEQMGGILTSMAYITVVSGLGHRQAAVRGSVSW
jgi:hypothetical protein